MWFPNKLKTSVTMNERMKWLEKSRSCLDPRVFFPFGWSCRIQFVPYFYRFLPFHEFLCDMRCHLHLSPSRLESLISLVCSNGYSSYIIHPLFTQHHTQQSNHLTDAPHLYTLRKNNSSERISKWFLTRIISDQTSGESVPHIVKYPPSNDHFLTKHFFQCSQPVTEHKNQQKGIIPLGPSGARLFSNSSRRPSLGWWQEKQCIGSCIQSSRFHTLKTPPPFYLTASTAQIRQRAKHLSLFWRPFLCF